MALALPLKYNSSKQATMPTNAMPATYKDQKLLVKSLMSVSLSIR
jgi:hypothetical protein